MYFPIGLPQYFKLPRAKFSSCNSGILSICSNRDRSLILLLSSDSLHIWFCKPSVQITSLRRSKNSLTKYGCNLGATWKSDATTILVTTEKGYLILYSLEIRGGSSSQTCLYLERGYSRKHQKDMFLGEGIPALVLIQRHIIEMGEPISCVAYLREELMVATKSGSLTRLSWDGRINELNSTHLKEVGFSFDLQQSGGERLRDPDLHVVEIEYSPLLGGFVAALSDGRGFFLTAPTARFDRQLLHGVWAPDLRDAVCVHANHKYRLIVFGCTSGRGIVYHIDPATGSLKLLHTLTVSSRQYPDAERVGGAISRLAWTPDECAIVGSWKRGGVAVWSVFGALLYCSLNSSGFASPTQDSCVIKAMEWGAEGYQLWISTECGESDTSEEDDDNTNVKVKPTWDFFQLQFVKSPLTVNPCITNHKHLFLQGEDKLYVNLTGDTHETRDPSTNIANKQWNIVPINLTYLGTNWPIRYSAIDETGMNLAIAGRMGIAHYSLSRRKWVLFGNEAQEKALVVSGGLVWWKEFICAGCFNLSTQTDEVRFYPSNRKLDNAYCSSTRVPFAILLLNIYQDFLICLCADKHIIISTMTSVESNSGLSVELRSVQDVSVDGFIAHPMCVTFITLSTLRTETNQDRKGEIVCTAAIPESILLNVAGRLLMFQRDWSGPQPKQLSNKYRPVPFCNPMMVASSVENVWIPSDSQDDKKPQLAESLWLSSGVGGMKVWLTLMSQSSMQQRHSFMSKREMLPFVIDIYPLAVLAADGVVLGAAADNTSSDLAASTPSPDALPSISLERTRQVYLHQVLRTLLKRNLGYHALQLARCFTTLPYFSHILELLLHEVLEEEATSKDPIPDPLLPRVVAFAKEFPEFRKTVAHCARKTEIALWNHLFSAVGSPKALFEECLVNHDLETAASYVIILHNLEKYYISRQLATLLLESALEKRNWTLSKDVVRFLKRIDPMEADNDPVARPLAPLYGERFTTPPLDPDDQNEAFALSKAPLSSRNHSLSFYEADGRRTKEKLTKTESGGVGHPSHRGSISTGPRGEYPSNKNTDEADKFDVDQLLFRHARKLLSLGRIRDLGLFAANLDDYKLVAFLRRESEKSALMASIVTSLRQVHQDFAWPLPILTQAMMYRSLDKYTDRGSVDQVLNQTVRAATPDHHGDLGSSETTKDIVLSPIDFTRLSANSPNGTPDASEDVATDVSDVLGLDEFDKGCDLSRSSSENQLHMMSMELANRGPQHSESELRYLYQVMLEAECYGWCVTVALVLRDTSLFTRSLSRALSPNTSVDVLVHLSHSIQDVNDWADTACLGYKPFLQSVQPDVDELNDTVKSLAQAPSNRRKSRHVSKMSHSSDEELRESEPNSIDIGIANESEGDNSGSDCAIM